MINNTDLRNLENLALLEQSQLIMEYRNLDKLKPSVQNRNPAIIEGIEKEIEYYESRLEELHTRILTILKKYKKESRDDYFLFDLDEIEGKIHLYQQDLKVMNYEHDRKFKELIAREQGEVLEESIIEILKQDIEEWLAMDQRLIDIEEEYMRKRNV